MLGGPCLLVLASLLAPFGSGPLAPPPDAIELDPVGARPEAPPAASLEAPAPPTLPLALDPLRVSSISLATLLAAELPGGHGFGPPPTQKEQAGGGTVAGPAGGSPEPSSAPTRHPDGPDRVGPSARPAAAPGPHLVLGTARIHGQPVSQDPGPAAALGALAGLVAIGLHHRLTKEKVLEHPARREILALLEQRPGVGTAEVARHLEVCYRTARHHLAKLARFDLVAQAETDGGPRWCLPSDVGRLREPLAPREARLLALITEEEGLHLSELARRLQLAKATAKHTLDGLTERGWITDERIGPLRRFFPTEAGREWIDRGTDRG